MYASSRTNKNIDTFLEYILRRVFDRKRSKAPATLQHSVSKDTVFIPSGWDTRNKIALLTEGLAEYPADAPFNSIIRRPPEHARTAAHATDVVIEDEQDFLQRLATGQAADGGAAPADRLEAVLGESPEPSGSSTSGIVRPKSTASAAASTASADGAAAAAGGKANIDTEQLQQFFTGLLKKPAGGSAVRTGSPSNRKQASAELNKMRGQAE